MTDSGLSLPPLSLYVHIPWCIKKCPYCDFNSHQRDEYLPEMEYVDALLRDLDTEIEDAARRQLHTIFIGGGTPSLFSAQAIDALLTGIRARIPLADNAEITLEVNPGSAEYARFAGYRGAGVNRLSIGVQSFQNDQLEALGRVHNTDDAKHAITAARDAGFDNFNIDLMHGLPGQSLAAALSDLETAISFEPPHISWYQLTIEPNTAFYSQPPVLPDDDSRADIQDAGFSALNDAGYRQYEVSAFARQGSISAHNANYWLFGDYIGIGAGAHGKLTTAQGIIRRRKTRRPADYMQAPATAGRSSSIDAAALPLEFMMNALRLNDGCDSSLYSARTGLPLSTIAPAVAAGQGRRLLEPDPKRLRCTELGHRFLNDTLDLFT